MILIQKVLSRAFPLMALSGLILAGWGLIITPDELKNGQEIARWGLKISSSIDQTANP
jgi:hypothetical protein